MKSSLTKQITITANESAHQITNMTANRLADMQMLRLKITPDFYDNLIFSDWGKDLAEEVHEALDAGDTGLAVEELASDFRMIISILMNDSLLGSPSSFDEFFELRFDELLTLDTEIEDDDSLVKVRSMLKFWECIKAIVGAFDQQSHSARPELVAKIDWETIEELGSGEDEEVEFCSGYLVLIFTLRRWLQSWVEFGEILAEVATPDSVI